MDITHIPGHAYSLYVQPDDFNRWCHNQWQMVKWSFNYENYTHTLIDIHDFKHKCMITYAYMHMLISTCVYSNTPAEKPVHMLTHTHRQMYTSTFGNKKYAHTQECTNMHTQTSSQEISILPAVT